MSNDRYYTAGTKEALFMLSRGYCYEPTCKERVMRWTEAGGAPRSLLPISEYLLSACVIFVVTVLALWAYATTRK